MNKIWKVIWTLCLGGAILLVFFLLKTWVMGATDIYHFERMVPESPRVWNIDPPKNMAIAPDGSVWLADNSHIQHLNTNGSAVISEFGHFGQVIVEFSG